MIGEDKQLRTALMEAVWQDFLPVIEEAECDIQTERNAQEKVAQRLQRLLEEGAAE